jgi:hypothetical protein
MIMVNILFERILTEEIGVNVSCGDFAYWR